MPKTALRIGIDFDNTIANFESVFARAATDLGFFEGGILSGKQEVKSALIKSPEGGKAWMRVQGQVYGTYMSEASVYDGFLSFLRDVSTRDIEIYIVSHKTEFGHYDPDKISLREVARKWLYQQGITAFIPQENIFFETTRDEKVARLKQVGCHVFIDDLLEVLTHRSFPEGTKKILFAETCPSESAEIFHCNKWDLMHEMLFNGHI